MEGGLHFRVVEVHVPEVVFGRVNLDVAAYPNPVVRVGEATPDDEILPGSAGVVRHGLPRVALVPIPFRVEESTLVPFVVILAVVKPGGFCPQGVYPPGEIQAGVHSGVGLFLLLVRLVDDTQGRGQHAFPFLVPGNRGQPGVGRQAEISLLHRSPLRVFGILPFLPERRAGKYLVDVGVVVVRVLVEQAGLAAGFVAAGVHLAPDGVRAVGAVFSQGLAFHTPVPVRVGEQIHASPDGSRAVLHVAAPVVEVHGIREKYRDLREVEGARHGGRDVDAVPVYPGLRGTGPAE